MTRLLGVFFLTIALLLSCMENPLDSDLKKDDQNTEDDRKTIDNEEEESTLTKLDDYPCDTEVIITKWKDTSKIPTDGFIVIVIDSVPDTVPEENEARMFFNFGNQELLSKMIVPKSSGADAAVLGKKLSVAALKKIMATFRQKLAALRRSSCILAELRLTNSVTEKVIDLDFDLRKSSVHSAVIERGLYNVTATLSHGIRVDWLSSSIKEVAFTAENTIDCRGLKIDTVNLSFVEKPRMLIFANLPSPPGKYTDDKYYKVSSAAPAGLQYVYYNKDTLSVWSWANLDDKFAQVNLEDDDSIVELSFFWDIFDFDAFKTTWTVDVGAGGVAIGDIEFVYEKPLKCDSIRYRVAFSETNAGEHVKLYFNKTCVISPLAWDVHRLGDTTTIKAQMNEYYSEGRGGILTWFPEALGFHFTSGEKYVFDLGAKDPYGYTCTILDTLTIP